MNIYSEVYYKFVQGKTSKYYPYLSQNPDAEITKTPQTKTLYSYNSYGEVIISNTYEATYSSSGGIVAKNGSKYITSSKTYNISGGSKIFGALASETDSLERTTRYYYDNQNGRLLACINVNDGTGICYSYDTIGNLKTVTPAKFNSLTSYTEITDGESVSYEYNDRNLLESIQTESTTYNIVYDAFGNTDSMSVGNRELANYEYNSNNGKLKKITYGNGFSVRYVYDRIDNLSEVWYTESGSDEVKAYQYSYTAKGQLYRFDDLLTGKSIVYKYDTSGRMTTFSEFDTESMKNSFVKTYNYDDNSRLSWETGCLNYGYASKIGTHTMIYGYSYTSGGAISQFIIDSYAESEPSDDEYSVISQLNVGYQYDVYNRLTKKLYTFRPDGNSELGYTGSEEYTYTSSPNDLYTFSQISSYTSKIGDHTALTSNFSYDAKGNITKIVQSGGAEYRYVYDDLGQLIREDNTAMDRTYVWSYDNAGNILSKKTYALTAAGSTPTTLYSTNTYGYNDTEWGDLLTKFRSHTITCDEVGNPLSYYNRSSYSFSWKNGGQLATASKGSYTLSFTYDDNGIRTSKTVNGVEHVYTLNGSQIVSEAWGNELVIYIYDAQGSPIGMQYRSTKMPATDFYTYWFEKNLQGDIIAVYTGAGLKVCSYVYDAWGNFTTMLDDCDNGVSSEDKKYFSYNCFRYRGYYYDSELGMYYLQSRYYDPATGRFISPNNINHLASQSINGFNQYIYCDNNSIGMVYSGLGIDASAGLSMTSGISSGSVTNNVSTHGSGSSGYVFSLPKANCVSMVHYTTSLIENVLLGCVIGNISYTATTQLNDAETFYSYSNIGNGNASVGVGMNLGDWFGISGYASENIGLGSSIQLTPWLTYGKEISLREGVSYSFGIISGDTTHEITYSVGWGTMAICTAAVIIAAQPVPGARVVAVVVACAGLLV